MLLESTLWNLLSRICLWLFSERHCRKHYDIENSIRLRACLSFCGQMKHLDQINLLSVIEQNFTLLYFQIMLVMEINVCILEKLPYSIRILLESAIRNCDEFQVKSKDVEKIIDWENTSPKQVEIPFKPARVLLQVNLLTRTRDSLHLLFK